MYCFYYSCSLLISLRKNFEHFCKSDESSFTPASQVSSLPSRFASSSSSDTFSSYTSSSNTYSSNTSSFYSTFPSPNTSSSIISSSKTSSSYTSSSITSSFPLANTLTPPTSLQYHPPLLLPNPDPPTPLPGCWAHERPKAPE